MTEQVQYIVGQSQLPFVLINIVVVICKKYENCSVHLNVSFRFFFAAVEQ